MRKDKYRKKIAEFYGEFNTLSYISNQKLEEIKTKYLSIYKEVKKYKLNKNIKSFVNDYKNINDLQSKVNNLFYENELKKTKYLLNSVNGYKLDLEQRLFILTEEKYTLLVAGAGSGKTLTIVGKVKYLLKYKDISPNEILCISFTKKASESLKEKLKNCTNEEIEVLTFHKLGLKILDKGEIKYKIADSDTLEYIVNEYMNYIILDEIYYMNIVFEYLEIPYKNIKQVFIKYQRSKEFILLKKLIIKFINLFKSNCYKRKMFDIFFVMNNKISNKKIRNKNKIFLELVLRIYDIYEEELNSLYEIDFNDMIIKSTEILESINDFSYKYIIIDEFQDTSLARLMLIKKLLKKTNANLIAVGDDWQSIYRFTGCNLNVFVNFERYFKNAKIMMLKNTYRNSNELLKCSSDFIIKNSVQIKKELFSKKSIKKPIKIVYVNNPKKTFFNVLSEIQGNVLVIGRNNNDIYNYIDDSFKLIEEFLISENFKDRNIIYLTAHKSKGLEEENVVILNLNDDYLGFPNKLKDNNELKFVIQNEEECLYAEERRLFYVALTRTKNNVYLLVKKEKESIFIKEILKDENVEIINFN